MRGLEWQIYMKIVVEKDLSMSEIQALFPEVSPRTIIRTVNPMVKKGKIEKESIEILIFSKTMVLENDSIL